MSFSVENGSDTRALLNQSVQGLEFGRDKSAVKTTMSARSSSARSSDSFSSASTQPNSLRKKLLPSEDSSSGSHGGHGKSMSGQEHCGAHQPTGMETLRRVSVCVNDSDEQNLLDYSAAGDVEKVKELLIHGVNVNCRDASARTPLHIAAYNGHTLTVQALIAEGADIFCVDGLEKTSLHHAAWKGYLEVAILLIDVGADVNALDRWGKSPLHHAAEWGEGPGGPGTHLYTAVSELLLSSGADKDVQDMKGRTALMMALQKSHSEIAFNLISNGASLALRDLQGKTALHYAAIANCQADLVAAMIEHGADVHVRDYSGRSPLFGATRSMTLSLIAHGADPHLHDLNGLTPLHDACSRASLEVAGALLESGAKVNSKDKNAHTPLDFVNKLTDSKFKGSKKSMEALLKHQGARKGGQSLFAACFRPIF